MLYLDVLSDIAVTSEAEFDYDKIVEEYDDYIEDYSQDFEDEYSDYYDEPEITVESQPNEVTDDVEIPDDYVIDNDEFGVPHRYHYPTKIVACVTTTTTTTTEPTTTIGVCPNSEKVEGHTEYNEKDFLDETPIEICHNKKVLPTKATSINCDFVREPVKCCRLYPSLC